MQVFSQRGNHCAAATLPPYSVFSIVVKADTVPGSGVIPRISTAPK
jgi:hypothetical protein